MERRQYPIVAVTTDGQTVHPSTVDVESLSEQLIPIRNALLRLFHGLPARNRGELKELELGLYLTTGGQIAFVSGNIAPSLLLRVGPKQQPVSPTRPRSAGTKATETPDVVEIT